MYIGQAFYSPLVAGSQPLCGLGVAGSQPLRGPGSRGRGVAPKTCRKTQDDDEDEVQALVVDNGSGMCKAGFAGDDAPRGWLVVATNQGALGPEVFL